MNKHMVTLPVTQTDSAMGGSVENMSHNQIKNIYNELTTKIAKCYFSSLVVIVRS